jgi:cytoskeletal protein RodZ
MLKRLIRSIRQKPKSSRDNIALIIALSFTGVVLLVWIINFPDRLAALEEKNNPNAKDDSPGFSKFFEGISDQLADLKENSTTTIESENQTEVEPMSSAALERINRYASNTNIEGIESEDYKEPEETVATSSISTKEEPEEKFGFQQREVRIITTNPATSTAPIE